MDDNNVSNKQAESGSAGCYPGGYGNGYIPLSQYHPNHQLLVINGMIWQSGYAGGTGGAGSNGILYEIQDQEELSHTKV